MTIFNESGVATKQTARAGDGPKVTMNVPTQLTFTVLKEGDDWAPRIKPGADGATLAFAMSDAALSLVIAQALGLPPAIAGKVKVVGALTVQLDKGYLSPEAFAKAVERGKTKAAKDAEAAEKRRAAQSKGL